MPKPSVRLLLCQRLRGEAKAVLAAAGRTDVELRTHPMLCAGPLRAQGRELTALRRAADTHEPVCVLLCGACGPTPLINKAGRQPYLARFGQCFELFAGQEMVEAAQAEGWYLLTPGWLKDWRRQICAWGFTQQTARDFFQESVRGLLLLDTGEAERPELVDQLTEMGAYLGLETTIRHVGLGRFEETLLSALDETVVSQARHISRGTSQEAADYGLFLELLSEIGASGSEVEVIHRLLDVFQLLFAPRRVIYLPIGPDGVGEAQVAPPGVEPSAATIEALGSRTGRRGRVPGGFWIRIGLGEETYGLVEAQELAVPEAVTKYLSVATTLGDVGGLAIANARATASVRRANEVLEAQVLTRTTALKTANMRLVQANELWQQTFDAVPDLVMELDLEQHIVRGNRAFRARVRASGLNPLGRPCVDVLHGGLATATVDCTRCRDGRCMGADRSVHISMFDGDFVVGSSRVVDAEGRVRGSVVVLHDVTMEVRAEAMRRKAEDKLRRYKRMDALGLMAGGVAHDLNNILSGIVTYPELLLMDLAPDDALCGPLEEIQAAGLRAVAIVSDLLTIARGVAVPKAQVDASEVVQAFIESSEFLRAHHATVDVAVRTDLGGALRIRSGRSHVWKCLLNGTDQMDHLCFTTQRWFPGEGEGT